MTRLDVAIVGGGPAGLSAGLWLGRCRRRVTLFDEASPRNAVTRAVHGFLSRDGVAPAELRRLARRDLRRYGVDVERARVSAVRRDDDGFRITVCGLRADARRRVVRCRRLLLATGLEDCLPELPGLRAQLGTRVHHCPYCDGWEHRDERLVAYGRGAAVSILARRLSSWSPDVLVCATGRLGPSARRELERRGIAVERRRLVRLEAARRGLRLHFATGAPRERDALFVAAAHRPASALAIELGCRTDHTGCILTGRDQSTDCPGVYAVGDATRGAKFAIAAAAAGAVAAWSIHEDLIAEDARERVA